MSRRDGSSGLGRDQSVSSSCGLSVIRAMFWVEYQYLKLGKGIHRRRKRFTRGAEYIRENYKGGKK